MRDRLIELIDEAINDEETSYSNIADYLLANGVIVPPCKVGDTVYIHSIVIWADDCGKCEHFRVGGMGDPHECARTRSPFKHPECTLIETEIATQRDILNWLAFDEFGNTVFLTKEEAERELKEREKV